MSCGKILPNRGYRGVNKHPNAVNRAYIADSKTKENTMAVIVTTEYGTDKHTTADRFRVTEDEHLEVVTTDNKAIARYRRWESVIITTDA